MKRRDSMNPVKTLLVALLLGLGLAFGSLTPTLAHTEENPCAESAEPGHSEFAQHHVREMVPGKEGHRPGEHQGLKDCVRK
jgi:hypothetical protein